jgi:hypothetical protein
LCYLETANKCELKTGRSFSEFKLDDVAATDEYNFVGAWFSFNIFFNVSI